MRDARGRAYEEATRSKAGGNLAVRRRARRSLLHWRFVVAGARRRGQTRER